MALMQYRMSDTAVHASGESRRNVVNVYHFRIDDTTEAASCAAIEAQFAAIWQTVDAYTSVEYSGCVKRATWYRLSEPPQRIPFRTTDYHNLVTGTDRLPMDLALCINFHALYISGSPRARRRGRVFIGPFASSFLNNTTGRPDSTKLGNTLTQWSNLLVASNASANWSWSIYSPTDDEMRDVTGVWTDDTWDTMRSRDLEPATRLAYDT